MARWWKERQHVRMAVAIGAGWALFLGFPVYVVLVLQQGGGLVGPWALGAAAVSIGLFVWLVVRYRPHILSFMVTHPWWYSVSCGIGIAAAVAVFGLASWQTVDTAMEPGTALIIAALSGVLTGLAGVLGSRIGALFAQHSQRRIEAPPS